MKDIYQSVAKRIKICHIVDFNPILSENKLEKVFCNLVGPLPRSKGRYGKHFTFLIIDHFTKYVLFPLNRPTIDLILRCIRGAYLHNVGFPQAIYSDNGSDNLLLHCGKNH